MAANAHGPPSPLFYESSEDQQIIVFFTSENYVKSSFSQWVLSEDPW